jgi:hypothetical protein
MAFEHREHTESYHSGNPPTTKQWRISDRAAVPCAPI